MPNEQTVFVRIADVPHGPRALGPFVVGAVYEVPADIADQLDGRFERLARLEKGIVIEALDARHRDAFEQLRSIAAQRADEAKSAPASPPKPAAAPNSKPEA